MKKEYKGYTITIDKKGRYIAWNENRTFRAITEKEVLKMIDKEVAENNTYILYN